MRKIWCRLFSRELPESELGSRAQGPAFRARVPLHAQSFLTNLARGTFEKAEFIVGNLHSLISKPAQITRAWRASSLALAPAILMAFGFMLVAMIGFERIRWERTWSGLYPGKPSLRAASQVYTAALDESKEDETAAKDVENIRAYLVNHFGELLTNDTFWANHDLAKPFPETERSLLRQAVAAHLAPAPESVQAAEREVPPRIRRHERDERLIMVWIFVGTLLAGAGAVALLEFFGCAIFRQSPILRLFGIAVVDRCGQPATRLRLVWRWAVAWLPLGGLSFFAAGFLVLAAAMNLSMVKLDPKMLPGIGVLAVVLTIVSVTLVLGTMIYAALRPERSLADRLAGTALVPK